MAVYDIDYMKMGLNALETFDEGEITLAGKLKINRYYKRCQTHKDDNMYCYLTDIVDTT